MGIWNEVMCLVTRQGPGSKVIHGVGVRGHLWGLRVGTWDGGHKLGNRVRGHVWGHRVGTKVVAPPAVEG